ncbi:MAG: class D sortase [Bryobacteraceae bacterium]
MRKAEKRTWPGWLLVAGGLFLLHAGTRDLLESWWGQHRASRSWKAGSQPQPAAPPLGSTVARLSIPRLGASWFVVEGVDQRDLRIGPGHMPGSAMPGCKGNSIIAGHRDLHFRALRKLREGDEIVAQTTGGTFVYIVTKIAIVKPTAREPLADTAEPVMNLITCYPFYYTGPAPRRYVVRADLQSGRQPS